MKKNVNQNASDKSMETYKRKEEITKALPDLGIFIGGIVGGLLTWIIIGVIHEAAMTGDIDDDFLYLDFNNLFSFFIIVGIVVLIIVLFDCAKLLGIIARNQVELMEQLGCSNCNDPQPVEAAPVEILEADKVAKLKELRDSGIISQDEFASQISKLQ